MAPRATTCFVGNQMNSIIFLILAMLLAPLYAGLIIKVKAFFGGRKGSPVLIEGRLKQESWTDKTTGQNRSKLKVVGESLQLLGSKDRAASGSQPAAESQSLPESQSTADAAAEYGDADAPF
jgi:hypothetical protein